MNLNRLNFSQLQLQNFSQFKLSRHFIIACNCNKNRKPCATAAIAHIFRRQQVKRQHTIFHTAKSIHSELTEETGALSKRLSSSSESSSAMNTRHVLAQVILNSIAKLFIVISYNFL